MAIDKSQNTLDKSRFESLFKKHFVHLCNFARQYVEDSDSAKDICQKVFINLWENRSKINPQQSVVSYLFTSVKNRCLNHIRDNKKYRSRVLDLDCGDIDVGLEEDQMAIDELKKKIEIALSELPEKCRLVFEMSRYRSMKYREIAEELDISQKTVEAHMSRAMKGLRENLKDYIYVLLVILGWFN